MNKDGAVKQAIGNVFMAPSVNENARPFVHKLLRILRQGSRTSAQASDLPRAEVTGWHGLHVRGTNPECRTHAKNGGQRHSSMSMSSGR